MTVHVLVARRHEAAMRRVTVDAYLREMGMAATPIICMLAALQHEKSVAFNHEATTWVVTPDDPQLYEHSYYDVALACHLTDRDITLATAPTSADGLPVWRVPVRFHVPAWACLAIEAASPKEAEAIAEGELERVRKITRPDLVYDDPFFSLVRKGAEEMVNDCYSDYVAELYGCNLDVAPEDVPVIRDAPHAAEITWQD